MTLHERVQMAPDSLRKSVGKILPETAASFSVSAFIANLKRLKPGLECDAVVDLRSVAHGLIEIKLGREKLIFQGTDKPTDLSGIIDMNYVLQRITETLWVFIPLKGDVTNKRFRADFFPSDKLIL